MLGNFHVELAFYGALGTFVDGSGIASLLTESGVLAEGSVDAFREGKFYNQCTRIHELFATAMERKFFEKYIMEMSYEERAAFEEAIEHVTQEPSRVLEYLEGDPVVQEHVRKYQIYFNEALRGQLGPTAQYWTMYIYMVNRVHRELQRTVRTNDVQSYIHSWHDTKLVFRP